ncbi:hypothetical protein DSECCO2_245830 [anaerobic digester metagenome]
MDKGLQNPKPHPQRNPVVRTLLMTSGVISALLGFAGIFLPLLPTTPFLLLSSWCFMRSSEKMNHRLLHNRYLGPYIRNYKSGRGITLRNKVYSLVFLWLTLSISFIFSPPYWWLHTGLAFIGITVTIHILKFKTLHRDDIE